MQLRPEETDLLGKWEVVGGNVVGDATTERIKTLIRQHLRKITTDPTGWDILYLDPTDGRYWELVYPESHMHGGGPPRLTYLSTEQARGKYGDLVKYQTGDDQV